MSKYKIIATSPVTLQPSIFKDRQWLCSDGLVSVAGVAFMDIPVLPTDDNSALLGRLGPRDAINQHPGGLCRVAIRSELTMNDFDVEIINAP